MFASYGTTSVNGRMINIRERRLHLWSSGILGTFSVTTTFSDVA
jgi:hypothetical protein